MKLPLIPCFLIVVWNIPLTAWVRPRGVRLGVTRFGYRLPLMPDNKESEVAQSELLRCTKSLNPFDWLQIPHLREKLKMEDRKRETQLREQETQRLERETQRLEQETQRLERETQLRDERKLVNVLYEGDDSETPLILSRKIFTNWISDDKFLTDAYGEVVKTFEDAVPNGFYLLTKKSVQSNFESYAEFEADVQTRDCVECIRSGELLFPPFNENGTIVIFDYNMPFGNDTKVPGNKFKSPVRPDAVLIHGDKWLVLESKHAFTTPLMNTYQAKCDFISDNVNETWVRRKHPAPTHITFVACSVNTYHPIKMSQNPGIVKVVRDGLAYRKLDSD